MREKALREARTTTVHIHDDEIRALEEDLRIWILAKNVIARLGAGGMSSEDSCEENGKVVYRVKIMIWRRRMEALLRLIDRQRFVDSTIYTQRGSKPGIRERIPDNMLESDWQWKSRRVHSDSLPEALYDPAWLQNICGDRAFLSLQVSREEFQYFDVERIRRQ
jgi:hypothetical protein